MNVFNVMLRMHCISNASSIFLFNILYAFDFNKSMYFECRKKQFEGRKNKVSLRWVSGKIIIKRIKSQFYFPAAGFSCGRRVCKTSIQKTMALLEIISKLESLIKN